MKTAVVILNWNTEDYLRQFLPGLLASCEGQDARVIVADNASADGSRDLLAAGFPEVQCIPFDENYGFTGGYNRALKGLEAEYYVLINSDIEVPRDWLSPLTAWMDTHPDCAVCGPKLLSWHERNTFEYAGAAGGLLDPLGYPFCRGRILNRIEKDHGQYDTPADVFWVSGACLMIRRSCWEAAGGLDARFFAHMEEIDLCWRLQLEGWRITVVPQSRVWHIGGGTLPQGSPWKLKLNFRNNLLMLEGNLARSFKAGHPRWTAEKCLRKDRGRIFSRLLLDDATALAYLLTGRAKAFRAILDAHREYRKIKAAPSVEDVAVQKEVPLRGWSTRGILFTWVS